MKTQPNAPSLFFRTEGYTIARATVPPDALAAANARVDAMTRDWAGAQPAAAVDPHYRSPACRDWLALARTPVLLDAVEEALGINELMLLTAQLQVKLPGDAHRLDWHQDRTYWPSVRGSGLVTACLALDDAGEHNGCLQVIPLTAPGWTDAVRGGTAGAPAVRASVSVTPELVARAVPLTLRAGDLSLHGPDVIHGAGPNVSARRRTLYSMRFANALSVHIDMARHHMPVYYLRGDGEGFTDGYIDARPGRIVHGSDARGSVA